jgi:hypothetical protein
LVTTADILTSEKGFEDLNLGLDVYTISSSSPGISSNLPGFLFSCNFPGLFPFIPSEGLSGEKKYE